MTQVTVIYDGGCSICRRFKRLAEFFDHKDRLGWNSFHDINYDEFPVGEEDCLQAMQVIDGEDVFSGYDAVRHICRVIPVLFPLYVCFSLPGVSHIGRRVYRYVASHRHCKVPLE